MKVSSSNYGLLMILLLACGAAQIYADYRTCITGPCARKKMACPAECPKANPTDPKVRKVCRLNCNSPICKTECKRKCLFTTVI